MKRESKVEQLVIAALIAAIYAALCAVLPQLNYGVLQLRLSELLTILPVFTPAAIPGLTVGCFLSNLYGLSVGANPAGMWDLLLGPLATFLAALLTRLWSEKRIKGLPVWSTLPPVLINAVIVGAELAVAYFDHFTWGIYATCALEIGVSQLAVCTIGGLLLFVLLTRTGVDRRLFGQRKRI